MANYVCCQFNTIFNSINNVSPFSSCETIHSITYSILMDNISNFVDSINYFFQCNVLEVSAVRCVLNLFRKILRVFWFAIQNIVINKNMANITDIIDNVQLPSWSVKQQDNSTFCIKF